ncbi:hypothetical protein Gotri_004008, partial [Gossypium trilobum]|nr:hypothetical protein [Gossypium trilobum]
MEEGEEGTKKRVSATTGFIASQLMMFISIYYVPLHLALGKPHTIIVLALPILSPILTKKLKGISETEEVEESEEERNIEIETISKGGGTNQKQWTEEDKFSSLFSEEEVDPSKIDEIEKLREGENEENVIAEHEICSRKSMRVVSFTNNQANVDTYTNTNDANDPDQTNEVALIHYSQQSDFRRDIIKGFMRAQRRKTITWELFQANIEKKDEAKREKYKREEEMRIEIAEAWDSLLLAQ